MVLQVTRVVTTICALIMQFGAALALKNDSQTITLIIRIFSFLEG